MIISRLKAAGALVIAATVLFTGCAGITHEPKVDMSTLKQVDDEDFIKALGAIGIDESDVDEMLDTSFSFNDDDTDFEVTINLDAVSDNGNQYSFTQCVDEETAKALFDYYYADYDGIFDNKDFSGISSHEVGSNTAYVLIDGRYDDKVENTYTPYHDAIYLLGDTVIVAIASDYDLSIEKEVNDFLDALGYPHP
ncbi:hypothetical protein [Butyrivibrio sp. AE2032]|uniref:hypothetical protein n=1 Tax=Butyrivibrio sp. AE2032 TaxID=1458463 RepID=UPI0005588CD5|nr:hypothetical protein [Butyrivibrio sp. AE2032]